MYVEGQLAPESPSHITPWCCFLNNALILCCKSETQKLRSCVLAVALDLTNTCGF